MASSNRGIQPTTASRPEPDHVSSSRFPTSQLSEVEGIQGPYYPGQVSEDPDTVMSVHDVADSDNAADSDDAPSIADDKSKISTQEKLQQVLDLLHSFDWSPRQFFLAWAGARSGSVDVELEHRYYRTPQRRKDVLLRVAYEIREPQSMADVIASELKSLIEHPCFGQFDQKVNLENIDFTRVSRTIKDYAPIWYATILQLISNQRAHRESYGRISKSHTEVLSKRLFAITSMVCFSRAKLQSNFLAGLLGTYLLGSGTKRRAIDSLAGLGVCNSYLKCKKLLDKVASDATRYV